METLTLYQQPRLSMMRTKVIFLALLLGSTLVAQLTQLFQ